MHLKHITHRRCRITRTLDPRKIAKQCAINLSGLSIWYCGDVGGGDFVCYMKQVEQQNKIEEIDLVSFPATAISHSVSMVA